MRQKSQNCGNWRKIFWVLGKLKEAGNAAVGVYVVVDILVVAVHDTNFVTVAPDKIVIIFVFGVFWWRKTVFLFWIYPALIYKGVANFAYFPVACLVGLL